VLETYEPDHFENKVVFKDKCLDYEEKICYSQAVERCHNVPYHKCTGTIETEVKRACLNDNELIFNLKEKVDFNRRNTVFSSLPSSRIVSATPRTTSR
jgi:hypothetical protein